VTQHMTQHVTWKLVEIHSDNCMSKKNSLVSALHWLDYSFRFNL